MSKKKTKKLIEFKCSGIEQQRLVMEVNGVKICVFAKLATVTPAEVTKDDVRNLVLQAKQRPGNLNPWWVVQIPGLDVSVEWSDLDGLEAEVANALNNAGVSVADWPPYRLDD